MGKAKRISARESEDMKHAARVKHMSNVTLVASITAILLAVVVSIIVAS